MELNLKLNSLCASPSSFYMTEVLTQKSSINRLALQTSPVIGRCISEVQISSEKSSPLPTPIVFNSKPKTPTLKTTHTLLIKKLPRIEKNPAKNEKAKLIKQIKPAVEKLNRKKHEKKKVEVKVEEKKTAIKDTLKKSAEKNKKLKEFGKLIRKQNLKCLTRKFIPEARWGADQNRIIKETLIKMEAEKESQSRLKQRILHKKPQKKILKSKKLKKKHLVNLDLLRNKSATKIQAAFRGYLTRKIFRNFANAHKPIDFSSQLKDSVVGSQVFSDEDSEVRKITGNDHYYNMPLVSALNRDTFSSLDRITKDDNLSKAERLHDRNIEKVLTAQIFWRLQQQAKLKELQLSDMEEMNAIAEKHGNSPAVVELFNNVLRRRYEKLNKFFEDHIESIKLSLISPEAIHKPESPNIDHIFATGSSREYRSSSPHLGEDIEKIWEQIETIEQPQEHNSFLEDPQPLPPLTPIFEEYHSANISMEFDQHLDVSSAVYLHDDSIKDESNRESPIKLLPGPPSYCQVPERRRSEDRALISLIGIIEDKEPSQAETFFKIPNINFLPDTLSMSLEHSEAIKDYSSIIPSPVTERNDDLSSLEYDLDIKCKSTTKNIVWPILNRQIFDRDSPSNPFSVTENSLKPIDYSGEDIMIERVLTLLELIIYHEIIDDNSSIFQDEEFVVRLLEDNIEKHVKIFIAEALRPRVVRHSTNTDVRTDTGAFLVSVDRFFLAVLKHPEVFKDKVSQVLNTRSLLELVQLNSKPYFNSNDLFELHEDEIAEKYNKIHSSMLVSACSQIVLEKIYSKKLNPFVSFGETIAKLKLSDFLMNVREQLYEYNELQAGNIPLGDTIGPDGSVDEEKLQILRTRSLAKLLYSDLEDDDHVWADYKFEEEQAVIDAEKLIFAELVGEVISIVNN